MTNKEAVEFLKNMIYTESLRNITAQDKTICQYHIEALQKAIAALERDMWISVEERLPERNTEVLAERADIKRAKRRTYYKKRREDGDGDG